MIITVTPNPSLELSGPLTREAVQRSLSTTAEPERENGKAAWLLGASFISEGAIPFAAADPLRVIPASMVGAAATGAISMAAGVTSRVPHGGIVVFFAIGGIGMWFLAIVVGAVVSALVLGARKRFVRRRPVGAEGAATTEADALVEQRHPVPASA